ncbi:MAG: hypothetical protein FJ095_21335 [Deltaproteobacteria bacterium]|nr:hypothetical protein [Deltaproteobacteria bacterium]
MARKLVAVQAAGLKNTAKTTIELDRAVGECVRAVAKYGGFATPGALIEAMLVHYCQSKYPSLELTFAEDDQSDAAQAEPVERRRAERRTKTGRAALWRDEGNVDRRKGSDRRKK